MADCSQALPLIEGIKAEHLLADKAYDTTRGLGPGDESGSPKGFDPYNIEFLDVGV